MKNILMICFIISISLGIKFNYDDYGKIKEDNFNGYDQNMKKEDRLLYDEKYKSIEEGNLFIEDMWYLMMMNSHKTTELTSKSHYFEYNGAYYYTDEIENRIEFSENTIECEYNKNLICNDSIKLSEDDYENEYLIFYKGMNLYIKEHDGIIIKSTDKEKEEKEQFVNKFTEETNILFKEYIEKTYACQYQVDCKNLEGENE